MVGDEGVAEWDTDDRMLSIAPKYRFPLPRHPSVSRDESSALCGIRHSLPYSTTIARKKRDENKNVNQDFLSSSQPHDW